MAMFEDAWGQRSAQAKADKIAFGTQIKSLDKQLDALLERIVDASSLAVVKDYEARIEKLETQKHLLIEKQSKTGKPVKPFETMFEHTLQFLANPHNLWVYGDITLKRTVLRLLFCEKVVYDKIQGVRTPKLSLPFNILKDNNMPKKQVVRTAGLEPARSYDREIFLPATVFTADARAPFVAWTIPSPSPRNPVLGAARLVSTPSA